MSPRPRVTPRQKVNASVQTPSPPSASGSRLLPLSIAGVVCFLLAISLGYGGWYFFDTYRRKPEADGGRVVQTAQTGQATAPGVADDSARQQQTPTPPVAQVLAPAGELAVAGGVVMLGGGGPGDLARKESVDPFAIAETEVTNEQYREFLKEMKHKAPGYWGGPDYPVGTANDPATGVTWHDAVAYCEWLSKKLGATVRLPSEKEWVLAAAGKDNFKYPWGNDWNPRAANSKEAGFGDLRPVKGFPEGVSPCGAYDMAGNAWEWVSDEVRVKEGEPGREKEVTQKIMKGGSPRVGKEYLLNTAKTSLKADENTKIDMVGFRYVVIRNRGGQ